LDSRNLMARIGRYYTVFACVRVCILLQHVVNVVLMEDVLRQAKDVTELTTVETIPTKPTAVCSYHIVAVKNTKLQKPQHCCNHYKFPTQSVGYLSILKVWRINDSLVYFDHILLRMRRNGRFRALA